MTQADRMDPAPPGSRWRWAAAGYTRLNTFEVVALELDTAKVIIRYDYAPEPRFVRYVRDLQRHAIRLVSSGEECALCVLAGIRVELEQSTQERGREGIT